MKGASSTTPTTTSGAVAAAMVAAPPLIDWPTITAGPPSCTDEGDEVAGDVRTAVAVPAEVGVAAAAEVDARHPVAGGDEARDDEAVGVPAVADAVGEHDEGALAGDVVGELAGADGELSGHVVLLD